MLNATGDDRALRIITKTILHMQENNDALPPLPKTPSMLRSVMQK